MEIAQSPSPICFSSASTDQNDSEQSLIEKDILDGNYDTRPLVDRYYQKKYLAGGDGPGAGDLCFLIHSNKLVVLALAPTHPIIKNDLTVLDVMFQVSDGINRKANVVSGKGKRGAQQLLPHSILCKIQCQEEPLPFSVPAGLVAKLIEVNENLVQHPGWVKSPDSKGYIGIMGPRMSDYEAQIGRLLSCEDYEAKNQL